MKNCTVQYNKMMNKILCKLSVYRSSGPENINFVEVIKLRLFDFFYFYVTQ